MVGRSMGVGDNVPGDRVNSLCIDLFCGLGGWAEGFLADGYDVIGFDIERHDYGTGGYPGQLVLQDALTLHGSQFRDATCIVASPPCQEFSFRAQPWKRARAKHPKELGLATPRWWKKPEGKMDLSELLEWKEWQRRYPAKPPSTELFDACFRIQSEACAAAGRYIPMVAENVKGAQPWVGRAAWHFGSFYLWGDVPALMPIISGHRKSQHIPLCETPEGTGSTSWFFGNSKHEGRYYGTKNDGGSWFNIGSPGQTNLKQNPDGRKVPGLDWSKYGEEGFKPQGFNVTAAQRYREGVKNDLKQIDRGNDDVGSPERANCIRNEHQGAPKNGGVLEGVGRKGTGGGWFSEVQEDGKRADWRASGCVTRRYNSKSDSRKAASAQIAKIPFPLANWIAQCFRGERTEAAS